MVDIMNGVFNMDVCIGCTAWSRNRDSCPYRNMSLLQYLDYKNILYEIRKGGAEIYIHTGYSMNSSAMIELNREIMRTRNSVVDEGWDFKVVK